MQNFIDFFLSGYSDVYLMAALILSIVIIEDVINVFREIFTLGGRKW